VSYYPANIRQADLSGNRGFTPVIVDMPVRPSRGILYTSIENLRIESKKTFEIFVLGLLQMKSAVAFPGAVRLYV
jgi:hypothetical protein